MNMHRPLSTLLLSLFVLPSCDGPKSSLGDLPTGSDTSASEDGGAATSDDTSEVPSSAMVGSPCQPQLAEVESLLLEDGNPQCDTGLCLYADTIHADRTEVCTEDSECTGFGKGVICNLETNECQLDPAHLTARSMCTETCEADDDCVGADGSACSGGFSCAPIASFGSLCCQKVCVCNDDIDLILVEELETKCADGTQEGCCEVEPPPLACGM